MTAMVNLYPFFKHRPYIQNLASFVRFPECYRTPFQWVSCMSHPRQNYTLFFFKVAFDFCQFCVVIRFFSPPQRPMTSDFKGFLYQILSITLLSYLNSFLLRLWYDAVLDCGLNPGPPALDASTIPLGYQGGGVRLI